MKTNPLAIFAAANLLPLVTGGFRPGTLDTTFTPDAPNGPVRAVAVQPDGKVLIGGDFTVVGATGRNRIARLHANGSLDTDFNPGSGANGAVNTIAVQADGKVLVGGTFTSVSGSTRHRIARFNSGGLLDGFNPGVSGGTTPTVHSIAVQPADGKIILVGAFTTVAGQTRNRIARLNSDGGLDNNFNPGVSGGAAPVVHSIALQVDNDGVLQKLLLGGDFTTVAGQTRNRIARLEADGSLDTGFSPGTPNGPVRSAASDKDGKVVIGGNFTAVPGFNRSYIARLNADGSIDTVFNPGTAVGGTDPAVYSVAVQLNGQVVIAGQFTSAKGNHVARLHGGGSSPVTLDDTFRPGPADQIQNPELELGANNPVRALAIAPDGLLVLGGEFSTYKVPGNPQPLSRGPRVARVGGL